MTTAADRIFVDTSVLVYSTVPSASLSAVALAALADARAAGSELWISRQILREFLAVLSRPQSFTTAIPMGQLLAVASWFETTLNIAEDGPAITARLTSLLSTIPCAGKQVHDANIVATMLAHGIGKLLTHNVADFSRFAGQVTIMPLIP